MAKVFVEQDIGDRIVIDNGSLMTKAGFAGDDTPEYMFRTIVGSTKHPNLVILKKFNAGDEAWVRRAMLKIRYPIEDGIITNFEDIEKLWNYTFYSQLKVVPEEHPVLLTESPLSPNTNREKMTEIMFETFNVPSLYIANQAVLSLIECGLTTGVVLDCGHNSSCITAIKDGCAISNAKKFALGGRDVNDYLTQILSTRYGNGFTTSERESVRDIKIKHGYVALDFDKEMENVDQELLTYEFPTGAEILFGKESFRCAEILFQPNHVGHNYAGIHDYLNDSIIQNYGNDLHLRNQLYNNIVLTGGNSLFPGFKERLERELIGLAPSNDIDINIIASPERRHSSWIGGSIFAKSLENWISKEEYGEVGPSVSEKFDLMHENIFL